MRQRIVQGQATADAAHPRSPNGRQDALIWRNEGPLIPDHIMVVCGCVATERTAMQSQHRGQWNAEDSPQTAGHERSRQARARMRWPMHFLLFGTYEPLVKAIKHALVEEGYRVDVAHDDCTVGKRIAMGDYDVIILDQKRPGDASLSGVRSWRRAGLRTPVVMLTPSPFSGDHVLGIEAGVYTWLTKPFPLQELLIRLRALAPDLGPDGRS
jgi:CheY-like chemotaxis protein